MQEYASRVVKKLRSLRVMVAIELYEVFVALVGVMQHLAMMWLDEGVTCSGGEKSWDKTVFDVIDGRKLVNVKVNFTLDR